MAINERLRPDADRYGAKKTDHAPIPDFEMRPNGGLAFEENYSRGSLNVKRGKTVRGTGKTARNRARGK